MAGESFAEGIYARDGGFYKAAGIDAQLSIFSSGGAMTAAVIGGSLDIGITNVGSMAAAHARGLPLYLIAPCALVTSNGAPTTALAVANDSPVRTAADLAGKTICLSTIRDLQQAATMTWLDQNGGNAKTATFVEIPLYDQTLALQSKRVDAAVLIEPWITAAKSTTRIIARPYESLAPKLITTGWIANKAWLDANPALAQKCVATIRRTAQWANRNPNATAAILENYAKIPHEIIASMNRLAYGDALDPALIQPIINAGARYGFLPHAFAATELFPTTISLT